MEERRIDELGRIVIPIGLRNLLNWEDKDKIRIVLNLETQEIILKKMDN